ncbi:hypothetical protein [Streptomyces sp. NBC_01506]|uniref:hypothetical protein n=1 Tax=Streptomyces sp. NBC_01506 TaxID=2903887 RepID=UPI00386D431E
MTVTFTPVAVERVKPVFDVVSTMPVVPPADGSATGPPSGGTVGVAVGEGVDAADVEDEEFAETDGAAAVTPATAQVSPAATIHALFLLDSNRRAAPDGAWLVES